MKHFVQPAVRRILIVESTETALLTLPNQHDSHSALPGPLFLIGGALDEDPVLLERFAALARTARDAGGSHSTGAPTAGAQHEVRIGIFTTASEPAMAPFDGDPETESDEADGLYYQQVFARHGMTGIPIPVGRAPEAPFTGATYTRASAEDEQVAELIADLDGLFFGGGDQTNYLFALFRDAVGVAATPGEAETPPGENRVDTPVMRAIRELHARGGVIAGTSAGLAIQQGHGMVTGGTSVRGWYDGVTVGYEDDERVRYLPAGGFGFFAEGLLDSHFNEWDRVVRAVCLGRATGNRFVFGVDEHTALLYFPGQRSGAVVGTGGVSIIDLEETEWSADTSASTVIGVRWHQLTAGDTYRFDTELIARSGTEHSAPGTDPLPDPEHSAGGEDVGPVLLRLAQRLMRSTGTVSALDYIPTNRPKSAECADLGYRVTLRRDERTLWTHAGGFSDLTLSITPLKNSQNSK